MFYLSVTEGIGWIPHNFVCVHEKIYTYLSNALNNVNTESVPMYIYVFLLM